MTHREQELTSPVSIFGGVQPPTSDPAATFTPTVFESPKVVADRKTLADMHARLAGYDLAAPPVVLPDFHHKKKMETPSSVAVATRDSIRPTLTSSSVNCGMALIALDCDLPDEQAIGGNPSEKYRDSRSRSWSRERAVARWYQGLSTFIAALTSLG